MNKIESLTNDALQLPEDQKFTLAHRLLLSVGSQEQPNEVAIAWDGEIRQRIKAYDENPAVGVPAGQVFQAVDEYLA